MRRTFEWLGVGLVAAVLPAPAAAQGPVWVNRPWTVVIERSAGGTSASGPIEQAMTLGGYSGRDCFLLCVDYPFSYGTPAGWTATIGHRLDGYGFVGATFGTSAGSETIGGRTGFIALKPSATTVGLLIGVHTESDIFWVGAGPAYFRVKLSSDPAYDAVEEASRNRIGGIIAAGLRFPSNARAGFVEFRGEYRITGSVEMGPLDVSGNGSVGDEPLPATSVNFNHWMISAGLGVRVGRRAKR